jgi:hypothetical protein
MRVDSTGENVLVNSILSTTQVTVQRAVGSTAAAAIAGAVSTCIKLVLRSRSLRFVRMLSLSTLFVSRTLRRFSAIRGRSAIRLVLRR